LHESCTDHTKSYQFINNLGRREGERAPYTVLSIEDLRTYFDDLKDVSNFVGFGYWGVPSVTAVTPFQEVCFVVICISKLVYSPDSANISTWDLNFPQDITKVFTRVFGIRD